MADTPSLAQTCIVHLTRRASWEAAQRTGAYAPVTLQHEGFIHCSTPAQLLDVANHVANPFLGQQDLVLLYIDPARLQAELKYEVPQGEQDAYPHLYGSLNLDAVIKAVPFAPGTNGRYSLPADLVG